MALADCRFDQRLYAEAIRLYISLQNEQGVDSLLARRQLYRCYIEESMEPAKRAENLQLAVRTLDETAKTLHQLDDAAFQGRPESERRAAWEIWLKGEADLLKAAGVSITAGSNGK